MGLVDERRAVARGVERRLGLAPVETLRPQELRREILRPLVLHHACGVGRDAVVPAVRAVHVDLVERSVHEAVGEHGVGKEGAPDPVAVAVEAQTGALPAVEVAEQVYVLRSGQPLAEPPAVEVFVALPAVVAVAVGVVGERPCGAEDFGEPLFVEPVAQFELFFGGTEPFVARDEGQSGGGISHKKGLF